MSVRPCTPPGLPAPPRRVVSLVPSVTESLFDLGLGEAVVGVTDYCRYPAEAVAALPRVGGPKNPRLEAVLALRPDLVIANREENTPQVVRGLEAAGVPVWVTFPNTVAETVAFLQALAALFRSPRAEARAAEVAQAVEAARRAPRRRWRYFVPIWEGETRGLRWWMTFNRDTYPADLLALLGGENIFAHRERRYPLEADLGLAPERPAPGRDRRYPRVRLEEIVAARPEVVLLPDEPCTYDARGREEMLALLAETPAGREGRVFLVNGTLLFWFGTRLAKALAVLTEVIGRGGQQDARPRPRDDGAPSC